jgi:hypothetical protein
MAEYEDDQRDGVKRAQVLQLDQLHRVVIGENCLSTVLKLAYYH